MLFQLGPYRIVRELSPSYGGCVYEAFDQAHSRKLILTQCPTTWGTEEVLERLELEARTAALLNHPHIARVFGFIRRDEHVYLVTEFVQGATLENILNERRRMPPALAVALFRQVMSGVAAAHRSGIVHGDLRPANVVVPDFGPVKILNLAFAHAFRQGSQVEGNPSPRYLAPEQLRGEPPDARSDVYSLGLMLYEAIVGEGPFECYTDAAVRSTAPLQFIPAPPSMALSDVPKRMDELLMKMIAPDPPRRFQSIRAVLRFLDSAPAALENSELFRPRRLDLSAKIASKLRPRTERYLTSVISPKWVAVAGFLFLIGTEMFFFRGENISELTEKGMQPTPSLNESVDAMFARLGTEATALDSEPAHKISPVAIRKTARREAPGIENFSAAVKSASIPVEKAPANSVREASVSQQNLSFTPPQRRAAEGVNLSRETNVAATEAINREQPEVREPMRSIPNNAPVTRLKVEWEN